MRVELVAGVSGTVKGMMYYNKLWTHTVVAHKENGTGTVEMPCCERTGKVLIEHLTNLLEECETWVDDLHTVELLKNFSSVVGKLIISEPSEEEAEYDLGKWYVCTEAAYYGWV